MLCVEAGGDAGFYTRGSVHFIDKFLIGSRAVPCGGAELLIKLLRISN